MKLKNKKEWLFLKSFELLKNNPNKFGLIILFDVLFLVSIYILQKLVGYFAGSLSIPVTLASAFIYIIFSLIYYLILLFVYSFFKYCILDLVKSLFEKIEFSFNKLGHFYLLNVILILPALLVFSFLLENIKDYYQPFAFLAFGIPLSIFLYPLVNISQSYYYNGTSIKQSICKGFSTTFTKLNIYKQTILIMILSAFFLLLLLLGSGYLMSFIAPKNFNLYVYFTNATIIFFYLVFYLVILINRISFYQITKKVQLQDS